MLPLWSSPTNFPNNKDKATSVGAYDIIKKAKVFKKVEQAINPFNLVISFSARRRDINKKHISLKELRKIVKKKNLNVGLMFGPEASGLSNQDLSFANYILQIPTSHRMLQQHIQPKEVCVH